MIYGATDDAVCLGRIRIASRHAGETDRAGEATFPLRSGAGSQRCAGVPAGTQDERSISRARALLSRCHLPPRAPNSSERVWGALQTIPYGETWSYEQLAADVGTPGAVRAVGAPPTVPIASPVVIPCHRVVRKTAGNRRLRGGGRWRKVALLRHGSIGHEARHPDRSVLFRGILIAATRDAHDVRLLLMHSPRFP